MVTKRWDPTDIEAMRRQMEGLMGRLLGRTFESGAHAFLPNVEVYATDKEVVVNAELAGMNPEDVTVEVNEDAIRLYGENSCETEVSQDNYYRSERSFGRFDRLIALPEAVKETEAKATFKNGLLTIRAPLAQQRQPEKSHKVHIETQ